MTVTLCSFSGIDVIAPEKCRAWQHRVSSMWDVLHDVRWIAPREDPTTPTPTMTTWSLAAVGAAWSERRRHVRRVIRTLDERVRRSSQQVRQQQREDEFFPIKNLRTPQGEPASNQRLVVVDFFACGCESGTDVLVDPIANAIADNITDTIEVRVHAQAALWHRSAADLAVEIAVRKSTKTTVVARAWPALARDDDLDTVVARTEKLATTLLCDALVRGQRGEPLPDLGAPRLHCCAPPPPWSRAAVERDIADGLVGHLLKNWKTDTAWPGPY